MQRDRTGGSRKHVVCTPSNQSDRPNHQDQNHRRITAYSAISWPSSCDQSLRRNSASASSLVEVHSTTMSSRSGLPMRSVSCFISFFCFLQFALRFLFQLLPYRCQRWTLCCLPSFSWAISFRYWHLALLRRRALGGCRSRPRRIARFPSPLWCCSGRTQSHDAFSSRA